MTFFLPHLHFPQNEPYMAHSQKASFHYPKKTKKENHFEKHRLWFSIFSISLEQMSPMSDHHRRFVSQQSFVRLC